MTMYRYATSTTGNTLYAIIRRTDALQVYNVSGGSAGTFENFDAGSWDDYDLAMTEQGSTGTYSIPLPDLPPGKYDIEVRQRIGASPATSDPIVDGGVYDIGSGEIYGVITGTPAVGDIDVTLAVDRATGFFDGAFLGIVSGGAAVQWRKITTHNRTSATEGQFLFAGAAGEQDAEFETAPASGDVVIITGRG